MGIRPLHKGRLFVGIALAASLLAAGAAMALPSYESVRAAFRPSETLLLDRRGGVLHELRTDFRSRRLAWTELADIAPVLRTTVIRAEDKRFYQHHGVDCRALAVAALRAIFTQNIRGASTISMQVASLLDTDLQPTTGRRSLRQKWRQIRSALRLERSWSKDQILEAYLNLLFFRGESQGVASASWGLFRKAPHGLDAAESVVLASLIRSPNAGFDHVAGRAVRLAQTLNLPTSDQQIHATAARALGEPAESARPREQLAPHIARRLLKGKSGEAAIGCTLDAELQRFVIERLRQHLIPLNSQHVEEGAALVVDNQAGEVLAYASYTADPARSRFVDGVAAKRQAGSTLKPFLYALALERRLLTPASELEDSPLDVSVPNGIYQPRNYDGGHRGAVSVREALASSMNIPAVRTVEMVGIENFLGVLRGLGVRGLQESADFFGPSVALGTADVTLWELVGAYRALANGGVVGEMRLEIDARSQAASHRVFSEDSAFLVSDILSDREARRLTFGLESVLATRFWTAVKTGTSKDMRDNWCIGYSRCFTVGVWVGNFSGEPMWDVSGLTGAAPLWLEIMNRLQQGGDAGSAPTPPQSLVRRSVRIGSQSRQEWFIRGTEPASFELDNPPAVARIVYPPAGAVFAVDPDIPAQLQRMLFAFRGCGQGLQWILDGQALGAVKEAEGWDPTPGAHFLELGDGRGEVVDAVGFRVRGFAGNSGEED